MASESADHDSPPTRLLPAATVRRWDRSDAAIGFGLMALIISLFLPWFSGTVGFGRHALGTATENGPHAHGYLWLVLVLAIAALAVLVARDVIARIPGNLPSTGQLLAGTTGLALILTVLGLAFRPPSLYRGPFGWTGYAPLAHFVVSVSWSYGGFVAVAAAVVAFVAAFISSGPLQEASRAERVAPADPATGG